MAFQNYDFGSLPLRMSSSTATSSSTSSPKYHGVYSIREDSQPHLPINDPTTPPETPIDEEIPRDDIQLGSTVYIAPTAPNVIMVSGIAYSLSQLRVMSDELEYARLNGEFPPTSAPLTDTQFIVDDHQALLNLRAKRGSSSTYAPEEYIQLHADIANVIKRRDASLGQLLKSAEVARRTSTYLRSLEQERRFYEAANTMLQRRGITTPTQLDLDAIGDEICNIVERSVEHIEDSVADATRLNVRNLRRETSNLREHDHHMSEHDQHLREHDQNLHHQIDRLFDSVEASKALLNPQSTNLQNMAQNLSMASGLVGHLSQMMIDMPEMINQAVSQAVNNQTGLAIPNETHMQNKKKEPLHEGSRSPRPTTARGPAHRLSEKEEELSRKEIEAILAGNGTVRGLNPRAMTMRRSKLRRMMRKVLRRRA